MANNIVGLEYNNTYFFSGQKERQRGSFPNWSSETTWAFRGLSSVIEFRYLFCFFSICCSDYASKSLPFFFWPLGHLFGKLDRVGTLSPSVAILARSLCSTGLPVVSPSFSIYLLCSFSLYIVIEYVSFLLFLFWLGFSILTCSPRVRFHRRFSSGSLSSFLYYFFLCSVMSESGALHERTSDNCGFFVATLCFLSLLPTTFFHFFFLRRTRSARTERGPRAKAGGHRKNETMVGEGDYG